MISQTAEYALRAVVYLGAQHGAPRTTAEISMATDAPVSSMSEVMQRLTRAGIVGCHHGLYGGFALNIALSDLTILDVVCAVGAMRRIEQCPLGEPAEESGLCPLNQHLDHVMADAERTFNQTSMGALLVGPNTNHLCEFPCVSHPSEPVEA